MPVHMQDAAGSTAACGAGARTGSEPTAAALRHALTALRHRLLLRLHQSPCHQPHLLTHLLTRRHKRSLQTFWLCGGVAGVDRPLADAQAGDLLVAAAAGGEALWLEVLERRPRPDTPPAPGPAEARSRGQGPGAASSRADPDGGGGGAAAGRGAARAAEPALVAACCGERLELHADGPGRFVLHHAGAPYVYEGAAQPLITKQAGPGAGATAELPFSCTQQGPGRGCPCGQLLAQQAGR
jgi:hypothetical protein